MCVHSEARAPWRIPALHSITQAASGCNQVHWSVNTRIPTPDTQNLDAKGRGAPYICGPLCGPQRRCCLSKWSLPHFAYHPQQVPQTDNAYIRRHQTPNPTLRTQSLMPRTIYSLPVFPVNPRANPAGLHARSSRTRMQPTRPLLLKAEFEHTRLFSRAVAAPTPGPLGDSQTQAAAFSLGRGSSGGVSHSNKSTGDYPTLTRNALARLELVLTHRHKTLSHLSSP